MVKDGVQTVGKGGEMASAGQIAAAIDSRNGGEWSVRLLSGAAAGLDLSMPRHCLESYNGETSLVLILWRSDVLTCFNQHLCHTSP